jgi:hypothetical protein
LLEAAFATGGRIAALDEVVRGCFHAAAASIHRLRGICWVNPEIADEDPLQWLRDGAPAENVRMLGAAPAEE